MAIARFPSIVIDCPDPGALATFYGAMLDWKVEISSGWADVRADYGQCVSFQQVKGYIPPRWPTQDSRSALLASVSRGLVAWLPAFSWRGQDQVAGLVADLLHLGEQVP